MKGIILAGGSGTRLRPLTVNTPKPMVPILNRPFLEHVLLYLKRYGIEEVILATHYLPNCFQAYLSDSAGYGLRLTCVVEEIPLGTAGAVKNVAQYLDDTFLVFNGDIFTDLDLSALIAFHKEKKAQVTIALTPVDNPTIYGVVESNGDGRVLRFLEKPGWEEVTTNLINAGIYVLEPEVLELVSPGSYYMFENGLFPLLLRRGEPVYGYPSSAYWLDIGTPEKYLKLHSDLLRGEAASSLSGRLSGDGLWLEEGCQIDPSAKLHGPVILGKGCRIGPKAQITGPVTVGAGCQVGRGAVIQEAVLWEGVTVGAKAILRHCIVGRDVRVGDNAWITDGAVLGDEVTVGSGNKLERGIRIWCGQNINPNAISF